MRTQNIFIVHPENTEQTNALKAFMKALKIKFEISKEETYKPDFISKIEESREQYKKGEFITVPKKDIVYTTYHLTSARDVSTDILEAIKATFKSKPITIIVEEDDIDSELTADMTAVLDERLQEDESTYLSAEESINQLNKKYGL